MRHHLVRLLGGGIEADRVIRAVVLGEGQLAVGAVDRARRGIDEVLDLPVPAGLQHVHEAHQVRGRIGLRIDEAHARLGGEVDHLLEAVLPEKLLRRLRIGKVEALAEKGVCGVSRENRASFRPTS